MKTKSTIGALALVGGVCAAYLRFVRPRVLDWGASPDEAAAALPGDDIVADAYLQTTRAVTVNAPPSAVWPWLAQMGPKPRAGAYTYDWIERLLGIDIENRKVILPEYQQLQPGEFMGLNSKGEGIRVEALEPERYLALRWLPQGSSWTFVLKPVEGGTRLISRNRLPRSGLLSRLFMVAFMEPGSLVMERKMLLTIKALAEDLWRGRTWPAATVGASG
jgi:hypothetical protein